MPMAKTHAADKVAPDTPVAIVPNATPMASPSGMLCNVIAITNKIFLLQDEETPSGVSAFK